jgi:hypothetical protein
MRQTKGSASRAAVQLESGSSLLKKRKMSDRKQKK